MSSNSSVRKKVLTDMFLSPWGLVPFVAGGTAFMGAIAFGGPKLWLAALGGIAISAGVTASRVVFGLEKFTEDAVMYQAEEFERKREAEINELRNNLAKDGESKTDKLLDDLLSVYNLFCEKREQGLNGVPHGAAISEKVDTLFDACIKTLENSYEIFMSAQALRGRAKREMLSRRKGLINEVVESIEHLVDTVDSVYSRKVNEEKSTLSDLRDELDQTISIARKTDESLSDLRRSHVSKEDEQIFLASLPESPQS